MLIAPECAAAVMKKEMEEKMKAEKDGTGNAEERPKRSKLTSAKLWVTLWAIAMVSFIVISDRAEFMQIAQPLCFVPLGYIGANVWQKKIYEDGAK